MMIPQLTPVSLVLHQDLPIRWVPLGSAKELKHLPEVSLEAWEAPGICAEAPNTGTFTDWTWINVELTAVCEG